MTVVRSMREDDVRDALVMMRELAAFEGYLEDFRVTERDLLRFGFGPERKFTCFVAASSDLGERLGIAVVHSEPWNYQMAPTFVLKELYVRNGNRGAGVGTALFRAAEAYCRSVGAVRLRWLVLEGNTDAARFYKNLGGEPSAEWRLWGLPQVVDPPSPRVGASKPVLSLEA